MFIQLTVCPTKTNQKLFFIRNFIKKLQTLKARKKFVGTYQFLDPRSNILIEGFRSEFRF